MANAQTSETMHAAAEAKLPQGARHPSTVLIVGAGPTLACMLARDTVRFRLIEAAAGPQPVSRGKGI